MKRKIVSILLAVVICFGMVSTAIASNEQANSVTDISDIVPAAESDRDIFIKGASKIKKLSRGLIEDMMPYLMNVVFTSENMKSAVDIGIKSMIKFGENLGVIITPTLAETDKTETITLGSLKHDIQKYIYVKASDVDEEVIETLKDVQYKEMTLDDGSKTVYVLVDIEKNPEIFDYAVFRKAVEEIYANQGKALSKGEDGEINYLMSYEHIAGELALHALVYAATNKLIQTTGTNNETILKLYNTAKVAELNIDESRVPSKLISFIGVIIMDVISFNLLKVFGIIKM